MKNLLFTFQSIVFQSVRIQRLAARLVPLVLLFIWLQACSQSPAPGTAGQAGNTILADSSASVLGDSPNGAFRLFKFIRKSGEQELIDLKILRLYDLKETLVATVPAADSIKILGQYPKFYWSKESKYLVTETSIKDSIYQREVLIFDLNSFNVASHKQGYLLNFDQVNDFAFTYRQTTERQIICFYNVNFPDQEQVRELVAPPSGQYPVVLIAPLKKEAKVKAYMSGGVPINFAFNYSNAGE